jgi:hypothetical protein
VTFLTFSLNEGNRTPYRESVASALINMKKKTNRVCKLQSNGNLKQLSIIIDNMVFLRKNVLV